MRGGLLLRLLSLPLLLLLDPLLPLEREGLLLGAAGAGAAGAAPRGGERDTLRPRGSPSPSLTPAGWYRSGASTSAR